MAANGPCIADGQSAISGGLLATRSRRQINTELRPDERHLPNARTRHLFGHRICHLPFVAREVGTPACRIADPISSMGRERSSILGRSSLLVGTAHSRPPSVGGFAVPNLCLCWGRFRGGGVFLLQRRLSLNALTGRRADGFLVLDYNANFRFWPRAEVARRSSGWHAAKVGFRPIVLKNSLRKFELVRSKKIGPRQSLSVGLNVQSCTESNCHGRRDRKFGRPFVKTEFFNRIDPQRH